ncbi:hypothetical protein [Streptomyces sp. CB03911]|uniref:hypothetical protein n=1 Tax=Streptomycetaceae TaxID=2062 RepID=UPI0018FE57E2|nr:hypothetical protein [Streptomyces sp. CB03911]
MGGTDEPGVTEGGLGVLSAGARTLYLSAVRSGGRLVPAESGCDGTSQLRELVEIGLLVPDMDDPGVLVAVDPRQLTAGLSAAWQRKALELLSRSMALPSDFQQLSQAYSEVGADPREGGPVEHLVGKTEINQRLSALFEGSTKEILSAQPGGGARSFPTEAAIALDVGILRRGVSRRTIYQPSTRYSAPTRHYVTAMTAEGGQVRTLDEPFTRLMIIDRTVAVIPGSGDTERAAFIRDEAVIGYLLSLFEGCWERAIPFLGNGDVPPEVVTRLRRNIVRMMLQGVGHRVIARNLGLSERTLARHIAELREEFDAETLFQLGWKLSESFHRLPEGDGDLD